MVLIFDLVKSGSNIPNKNVVRFNKNSGFIGRSDNANLTLTDPQNYISNKHINIIPENDLFFIIDESTNGTFLKFPYSRLPNGKKVPIKNSDIFIIGDHEIQARILEDADEQEINRSNTNIQASASNSIEKDDFLFENKDNEFSILNDGNENAPLNILNTIDDDLSLGSSESIPTKKKSNKSSQIIPDDALEDDLNISSNQFDQLDDPISVPKFNQTTLNQPIQNKISSSAQSLSFDKKDVVDESLILLSKKLGIDLLALTHSQRNDMMEEMGDALVTLLARVHQSLNITKRMQHEMNLGEKIDGNIKDNPLSTHSRALELLQTQNRKDMLGNTMKLSDAVEQSFENINHHTIALHGATKNFLNSIGMKFSPKNLLYNIGSTKFFVNKNSAMWKSYRKKFKSLDANPDAGEKMFLEGFVKEYITVAKSLNLAKKN